MANTDFSLNIGETLDKWPGRNPFKIHLSKVLRGLLLNLRNEKIINLKHNSNNIFIYNNKKIKKIKFKI